MFKHILLATDGSAASERAVELAVSLARTHGAKLTALYVVDPYPYQGIGASNPLGLQAYMSEAHQYAAQTHAKVTALCGRADPAVDLQLRMAEGAPASSCIVQTAKDEAADLIVVGSHGRTGITRVMLGSVAGKVVAESPLPVLVAR